MAGKGLRERRDGYFVIAEDDILDKFHPPTANVKPLIDRIDEVSPNHINQALYEAANTFKTICVDLETMKDVMLNLHSKALSNPKFGEKYIAVLGQLSNYVVDNVPVRSELLGFIENDFKLKETMFQLDSTKFVNSVTLLGNVYSLVRIRGVPLTVLAAPMLEYLNLLLDGREEHHRVFAIQVMLNGEKIFGTEGLGSRIELLKQNMRRALIARELSPKSKCWILLALDYVSNDLKPLSEELRNFYIEALGDDYMHVKYLLKHPNDELEDASGKSGTSKSYTAETDDVFKDIEDLTIPPELLNAVNPRLRPPRLHRLRAYSQRLNSNNVNEREGGRESQPGNYDEDDVYGLQIERDRIRQSLAKRNEKLKSSPLPTKF